MTTDQHTVQQYLGDLIAVVRHVGEAIDRHARDDRLSRIHNAGPAVREASVVLKRQLAAMEYHAKTIGGTGVTGTIKEAVTSVTGFLTGLYGTMRGEPASRMLRDDYTGLSFVSICTSMLHTTALAVGDARTADLTRQHLDELPPVIMAISGLVPYAVVADLGADHVPIADAGAAAQGAADQNAAWRAASGADSESTQTGS